MSWASVLCYPKSCPWSEWIFLGSLVALWWQQFQWSVCVMWAETKIRYEITSTVLTPFFGSICRCADCPSFLVMSSRVSNCRYLRTFFGQPLSRRRIFIILVRGDCIRDDLGQPFDDYILQKLIGMGMPVKHTWLLVISINIHLSYCSLM